MILTHPEPWGQKPCPWLVMVTFLGFPDTNGDFLLLQGWGKTHIRNSIHKLEQQLFPLQI